jgi:hypothetical protein
MLYFILVKISFSKKKSSECQAIETEIIYFCPSPLPDTIARYKTQIAVIYPGIPVGPSKIYHDCWGGGGLPVNQAKKEVATYNIQR